MSDDMAEDTEGDVMEVNNFDDPENENMSDGELDDTGEESWEEAAPEPKNGSVVPEAEPDIFQRLQNERRDFDHRTALGIHFRELAILMNSKRKVQTGTLGLAMAYIDTDKTGDYDPKAERRKVVPKRKARYSAVRDENGNSIASSSKCAVSCGRKRIRSDTPQGREDGLTISDLTAGHSQRRGCKSCFLSGDDDCSLLVSPANYPCAACKDSGQDCEFITSPTLKKSCLGCKFRKSDCSYKYNGGKGVRRCEECDDLDEVCCAPPLDENSSYAKRFENISESISRPPPLYERMYTACQQCRLAVPPKRCSLKNRNSNGPCSGCKNTDENCKFLLPGSQQIKALESAAEANKAATKEARLKTIAARSGNASRNNGRTMFSKQGSRNRFPSSLYTEPSEHSGTGKLELNSKPSKRRPKSSAKSSPDGTTDGIKHKTITTAFAHPISFNYEASNEDPCSWCDSPFFGLYGHGEIKIEVIPYAGSKGNIELSAHGHCKSGKYKPSKMCVTCTFARMRISQCQTYEVSKLEGIDQRSFDAQALNMSLQALNLGDEEHGELARNTKFCSICASVANYACCKTQCHSAIGARNLDPSANDQPEEFRGCGLHLCKVCNWTLERIEQSKGKEYKLDVLGQVVRTRKEELWKWKGDEIRADCEFLVGEGEMMRRVKEIVKE